MLNVSMAASEWSVYFSFLNITKLSDALNVDDEKNIFIHHLSVLICVLLLHSISDSVFLYPQLSVICRGLDFHWVFILICFGDD